MSDAPCDSADGVDDFRPTASLATLTARAALLATVRRFFDALGYLEVETPILSRDVVVDAHLEPFATSRSATDGASASATSPGEMFLQTSPEFGMKRLLAAGATAIYQVTRAFRVGEQGTLHNPEFTIVEWYRVGDTHHDQMSVVEALVAEVVDAEAALSDRNEPDSRSNVVRSLPRPFGRLTYDDAFRRLAGEGVLEKSPSELARMAEALGVEPPPGLEAGDRDSWLNLLLAEIVEPRLGRERPEFLYDYPASQGALAVVRRENTPVAERFELYVDGIELCNGYHELTDANELRSRIEAQSAIRRREGHRSLPRESRLLAAMDAGLPACAGVALGFDRLVMLALGKRRIQDVLAFPFDRA